MNLERVKVRQRTRRGEELVRSGKSLTNIDRKYTVSGCFFLHLTYLSQVLADQSKCDLQYSEENVSWSLFAQHCKVDQLKIVQEARNPLQSFIPVPTQYRYLYSISNQYPKRVKQSFIIKTLPDPLVTFIFIRIMLINLGKKKGKGVDLPGPGRPTLWNMRMLDRIWDL